jgi:dihydropteroate synthase
MTSLVGILNCTPDSFSDGKETLSPSALLALADQLVKDGADILDIGGDSSRPGSRCVGPEEEWRRISPVVEELASEVPCSIDTHHFETAYRALDLGARFINDISGSPSPEMIDVVARYGAHYIVMFNPHKQAHVFGAGLTQSHAISTIQEWMDVTSETLQARGLPSARMILDPGMGAFLSDDPLVSWSVIEHMSSFISSEGGLLVGCSRKGFLKLPTERSVKERDLRSAICGAIIAHARTDTSPLYLRVHNVGMQKRILAEWTGTPSLEEIKRELTSKSRSATTL